MGINEAYRKCPQENTKLWISVANYPRHISLPFIPESWSEFTKDFESSLTLSRKIFWTNLKISLKSLNLSVFSLVLDLASPSPALAFDQILLLDLGGQLCDLDMAQCTLRSCALQNTNKYPQRFHQFTCCCLLQLLLLVLEQHGVGLLLLLHQQEQLLVKEQLDKFTRG